MPGPSEAIACPVAKCTKSYTRSDHLGEHLRKIHSWTREQARDAMPRKRQGKCPDCGKVLSNVGLHRRLYCHVVKANKAKPLEVKVRRQRTDKGKEVKCFVFTLVAVSTMYDFFLGENSDSIDDDDDGEEKTLTVPKLTEHFTEWFLKKCQKGSEHNRLPTTYGLYCRAVKAFIAYEQVQLEQNAGIDLDKELLNFGVKNFVQLPIPDGYRTRWRW